MSTPDLDAIQARADAATEGPWEPMRAGLLGTRVVHVDGEWEGIVPDEFITLVTPSLRKYDDAVFMSHARTDVPALLAYARDLEARIGRAEDIARQIEVSAEPRGVEEFYAIGKVSARVVSERLRAALNATDAS